MSDRHWVMVFNKQTDECRFMHLIEGWLPFKYNNLDDIQPCWDQIGFYESQYDAFSAFMDLSENLLNTESSPDPRNS